MNETQSNPDEFLSFEAGNSVFDGDSIKSKTFGTLPYISSLGESVVQRTPQPPPSRLSSTTTISSCKEYPSTPRMITQFPIDAPKSKVLVSEATRKHLSFSELKVLRKLTARGICSETPSKTSPKKAKVECDHTGGQHSRAPKLSHSSAFRLRFKETGPRSNRLPNRETGIEPSYDHPVSSTTRLHSAFEAEKAEREKIVERFAAVDKVTNALVMVLNEQKAVELPTMSLMHQDEQKYRDLIFLLQKAMEDAESRRRERNTLHKELEQRDALIFDLRQKIESQNVHIRQLEERIIDLTIDPTVENGICTRDEKTANPNQVHIAGKKGDNMREYYRLMVTAARFSANMVSHTKKIPTVGPGEPLVIFFLKIQGAAQLWERLPVEMREAVQTLNSVIRSHLTQYNGHEIKQIKDGSMFVFACAASALRFAIFMQNVLLNTPWDVAFDTQVDTLKKMEGRNVIWRGLRISMALNLGVPLLSTDCLTGNVDCFGPVINTAYRICQTIYGGCVVVTQEVFRSAQQSRALNDQGIFHCNLGSVILSGSDVVYNDLVLCLPSNLSGRMPEHGVSGWIRRTTRQPASSDAMAQVEEEVLDLKPHHITLMCVRIPNSNAMKSLDAVLWRQTFSVCMNSILFWIQLFRGTISDEDEDRVLVAFSSPTEAVLCAMRLQRFLMLAPWPDQILSLSLGKEVKIGSRVVFRGLRVQIGIHTCDVNRQFDARTENLRYYGGQTNVAIRISARARDGEILISDTTIHDLDFNSARVLAERPHLYLFSNDNFAEIGLESPIPLFSLFPFELTERLALLENRPVSFLANTLSFRALIQSTEYPSGNVVLMVMGTSTEMEIRASVTEEIFKSSVSIYRQTLKHCLKQYRAVLIEQRGFSVYAAFHNLHDALCCSMAIHDELLTAPYPWQLLTRYAACEKVLSGTGSTVWSGPRVGIALLPCEPHCRWNPYTNRVQYEGPVITELFDMMGTLVGGYTLVPLNPDTENVLSLMKHTKWNPVVRDIGVSQMHTHGVGKQLATVVASSLRMRTVVHHEAASWAHEIRKHLDPSVCKLHVNASVGEKVHTSRHEDKHRNDLVIHPHSFGELDNTNEILHSNHRTFVSCLVQGSFNLKNEVETYTETLSLYHDTLMRMCYEHQGIVKVVSGDIVAVCFAHPSEAIQWACEVQVALLQADWGSDLLLHPDAQEVMDAETGIYLFRGLRIKMGVYSQPVSDAKIEQKTDESLDQTSKPTDIGYEKVGLEALTVSLRLAASAHGGEILISEEVLQRVESTVSDKYVISAVPITDTNIPSVKCITCIPLHGRQFAGARTRGVLGTELHVAQFVTWCEMASKESKLKELIFGEQPDFPVACVVADLCPLDRPTGHSSPPAVTRLQSDFIQKLYQHTLEERMKEEGASVGLITHRGTTSVSLIFQCVNSALQWAFSLQEHFLHSKQLQDWHFPGHITDRIVGHTATREKYWSGPRLRVALHYGTIRVKKSVAQGSCGYFGAVHEHTIALCSRTFPGEIVVSQSAMATLSLPALYRYAHVMPLGEVTVGAKPSVSIPHDGGHSNSGLVSTSENYSTRIFRVTRWSLIPRRVEWDKFSATDGLQPLSRTFMNVSLDPFVQGVVPDALQIILETTQVGLDDFSDEDEFLFQDPKIREERLVSAFQKTRRIGLTLLDRFNDRNEEYNILKEQLVGLQQNMGEFFNVVHKLHEQDQIITHGKKAARNPHQKSGEALVHQFVTVLRERYQGSEKSEEMQRIVTFAQTEREDETMNNPHSRDDIYCILGYALRCLLQLIRPVNTAFTLPNYLIEFAAEHHTDAARGKRG